MAETDPTELRPVFAADGVTYVYTQVRLAAPIPAAFAAPPRVARATPLAALQHANIYLVALTKRNSNVTAIFVFLERLVEIMREYFGQLEEESIRDNFVLIYELLDEAVDYGLPQNTATEALKQFVLNEPTVVAPPVRCCCS